MATPLPRAPVGATRTPAPESKTGRDSQLQVLTLAWGIPLLLCLGIGLLPPTVAAQPILSQESTSAQRSYDIPSGQLSEVLTTFAGLAGINLSFAPMLTAGLHSQGLQGSYSVDQGLRHLLRDTQLEAVRQGMDVYQLRTRPLPSQVTTLEAVQVYGQNNPKDEMYRTAGSINILTRDDIERFRGTSVGDIFQGIPGVLVGENRNSGGIDVNIRGMQGQGRVPVLVDGARQETTVYRGYAGASSRSYIDPDLIGGITIEKGPTMNAGGTGATGGLVSMRTLDAADIVKDGETFGVRIRGTAIGNNSGSPMEPGQRAGYGISLGGGRVLGEQGRQEVRTDCRFASQCEGKYDLAAVEGPDETMDRPGTLTPKSWAGSLALAKQFESFDIIAAIAQRQQGNYYAGTHGPVPSLDLSERYRVEPLYTLIYPKLEGASRFRGGELIANSNYKSRSSLLKTRIYLPNEQQLDLSWMRYHSEYGELMPSQLMWFGTIRQTQNSEVTANTYTARYRWNPVDNPWLDLQANLWNTRTRSINRNYTNETLIINSQLTDSEEHYKRWGMDISNTVAWTTWGDHQVRFGAAAQQEDIDTETLGKDLDTGRKGARTEYSGFIAWQYKPVPSLTLDSGLRYTRYRSKDHRPISQVNEGSQYCQDNDGDGKCDPIHVSNDASGAAPMFTLTWEALDGLQLYARYAEAKRLPSLFETSSGFSVATIPDANLKPEHSRNREVGLNYFKDGLLAPQDQARLKFAYFNNHTKDYLTRTLPNTWEDTSVGTTDATMFRMRNIDSVSFRGFELSGSYDLGAAWLEFGGTRYTHIETCHFGSYRSEECTDYGIQASYINNMIPPKWHASATLGTRLLERRLVTGIRATFMGRRTPVPEYNNQGVNSITARPVPWHAYKIFDLFASYKVNDTLSFDFNIDNLTDRYYLDALGLGLVPAPGRTARLSATLNF